MGDQCMVWYMGDQGVGCERLGSGIWEIQGVGYGILVYGI